MSTTSGPWEMREMDNDKVIPTITIIGKTKRGGGIFVAKVDHHDDAVLIAAAPDLLAVIERALGILHPNTKWTKAEKEREWPIWEKSAREALAKAKGSQ